MTKQYKSVAARLIEGMQSEGDFSYLLYSKDLPDLVLGTEFEKLVNAIRGGGRFYIDAFAKHSIPDLLIDLRSTIKALDPSLSPLGNVRLDLLDMRNLLLERIRAARKLDEGLH